MLGQKGQQKDDDSLHALHLLHVETPNTNVLIYSVLPAWHFRAKEDGLGISVQVSPAPVQLQLCSPSASCSLKSPPNRAAHTSMARTTRMPHMKLVKFGLQRSPEHKQPSCMPWGTRLHSQDKLFLLYADHVGQKHQYFQSWTCTATSTDILEQSGSFLEA